MRFNLTHRFLVFVCDRIRRHSRKRGSLYYLAGNLQSALWQARSRKIVAAATAYGDSLVERGHCPHCLVVNCEHMVGSKDES